MDNARIISEILQNILENHLSSAGEILSKNYPFIRRNISVRSMTDGEKMKIFFRDGFIDRYDGKKLVNPGVLKCITHYFPEEFPYHPHWKMSECHIAYWELLPVVDHVVPIARGGEDTPENCVCTSMLNNSIKASWTLQELRWELCPAGDPEKWDGLTALFIRLVRQNNDLLEDAYIRKWYRASRAITEV